MRTTKRILSMNAHCVCLAEKTACAFIPCGHCYVCEVCGRGEHKQNSRQCPIKNMPRQECAAKQRRRGVSA